MRLWIPLLIILALVITCTTIAQDNPLDNKQKLTTQQPTEKIRIIHLRYADPAVIALLFGGRIVGTYQVRGQFPRNRNRYGNNRRVY